MLLVSIVFKYLLKPPPGHKAAVFADHVMLCKAKTLDFSLFFPQNNYYCSSSEAW